MRSRPTSRPIQKSFPSVLYSMHFTSVPKLVEVIMKLKTTSFLEQYLRSFTSFKQGKPTLSSSWTFQIPDSPSLFHCLEMLQFISDQLKIWYPELITRHAHTMPYIFSVFPHLLYYLIFTALGNRQNKIITIILEMRKLRLRFRHLLKDSE